MMSPCLRTERYTERCPPSVAVCEEEPLKLDALRVGTLIVAHVVAQAKVPPADATTTVLS